MAEFDMGLDGATHKVASLIAAVNGLGLTLDAAQLKSNRLVGEVTQYIKSMGDVHQKMSNALQTSTNNTATVAATLMQAEKIAQNTFASIGAANLKASIQAQAYNGSMKEMKDLLTDTAAKNNYVQWQQKSALITTNQKNENGYLIQSIASLGSGYGAINLKLKAVEQGTKSVITAEDRMQNALNLSRVQGDLLNTTLGKNTTITEAQNTAKKKLITLDTDIASAIKYKTALIEAANTPEGRHNLILGVQEGHKRKLVTLDSRLIASSSMYRAEMNALDQPLGQNNANLKVQRASKEHLATADSRLTASTASLKQILASLSTELGKLNANMKVQVQGETALATADQRLVNATKLKKVALEQLGTVRGHENVLTTTTVNIRRKEIAESLNLEARLAGLTRTNKSLNGGIQESIALMEQANRARLAEVLAAGNEKMALAAVEREIRSLNGGMAETLLRRQAVRNARKQDILDSMTEKKVTDEMAAALKRQENQLIKLQAQQKMLSSSQGVRMAQLKKEIGELERYNRLLAMSTAELFGFGRAAEKAALSQAVGSQSAAMLRAGLQGAQTSIGMYTSATIIAATATYALAAAIRSTITTGAKFTETMSRADAIMSTSNPSWMRDNTKSMQAMEDQVRALGQSSVYTASEVAQGLSELGMAGLSSGDAVLALAPSLALANIANVSMARSADIATNTMMTFGMGAKDLGGIVDIMATAVNNSNTDIEQLANALSYAGPAAQTAGISFKDTTAAIEALANAGFKGSRSGSALRRLFVSILNPTKKGSEVIRKYGLDVLDAEGNTRSLTDIVGQLNMKLGDLSGAERLGAIQNLVGVYATSAVSALVEQSDNLARLRRQLDDTAGASEKMQRRIADNLVFDWKQVISGYEEVQLHAFDSVEMRLRAASAGLSKWLIELTHPVAIRSGESYEDKLLRQKVATEQLIDAQKRLIQAQEYGNKASIKTAEGDVVGARRNISQQSITELDRVLVSAENAARAIGFMVAGIVAFKLLSGNVASAFAEDTKRLADILGVAGGRAGEMAAHTRNLTMTSNVATPALKMQALAAGSAAGALQTMGNAASWASAKLSVLATYAAGAMRFLGWMGLIAGIGYAIYDAFDNDVDKQILDQRDAVGSLKDYYEKLKKAVEGYAVAKTRAALEVQLGSDKDNLSDTQARLAKFKKGLELDRKANLPTQALEDEIGNLTALQQQFEQKITNTEQALGKLGTTQLEVARASDRQYEANERVRAKTDELATAQRNLAAASRRTGTDIAKQSLVHKLTEELKALEIQSAEASRAAVDVQARLVDLADAEALNDKTRLEEGNKTIYSERLSAAGKLYEAEKKMLEERGKMGELVAKSAVDNARYELAVKGGDGALAAAMANARTGQGVYEDLSKSLNEASEAYYKLAAASRTTINLANAQEALADYHRTPEQKLADRKNALINNRNSKDGIGVPLPTKALRDEAEAERLDGERKLLEEIDSIEKSLERKGKSGESEAERLAKEAKQALDSAQSTYDTLAKKIDPVTAAQTELKKATEAMDLLLAHKKITVDQYRLAMSELNVAYYEAKKALDLNAVALEAVKQQYNTSPLLKEAQDLTVLTQARKDDAISLQEYNRILERMDTARKESLISSLPKANLQVGDGSDSPFTDWAGTEIERAQGLSDYKKAADVAKNNEVDAGAGLDDKFKKDLEELNARKLLEQGAEAAHTKKLLEINEKYAKDKQNLVTTAGKTQQTIVDEQAKYAEQMASMATMAALGSIGNILGSFASASEDATSAQKAAFIAQKAITIAQILMYTHLAATQALTIPGDSTKVMGLTLASFITATGYANAGLVAALAVGELATGSNSSGTQMYDTGGTIPYNRVGIVGEYGPELVQGPAHVTGRGASASRLNGSNVYDITLAPVIHVTTDGSGGGTGADQERGAKAVAEAVRGQVMATLQDQMRPGGVIDTFVKRA